MINVVFFFFKEKTAYDMRISDGSSDVCSSDLFVHGRGEEGVERHHKHAATDGNTQQGNQHLPGTIMRDKGGNVVKLSIRRADPASCHEIKVQDKARHGEHRGGTVFRRYLSLKHAVDCYRSEERRVGKEGVRKLRSRWWPCHTKKK